MSKRKDIWDQSPYKDPLPYVIKPFKKKKSL